MTPEKIRKMQKSAKIWGAGVPMVNYGDPLRETMEIRGCEGEKGRVRGGAKGFGGALGVPSAGPKSDVTLLTEQQNK